MAQYDFPPMPFENYPEYEYPKASVRSADLRSAEVHSPGLRSPKSTGYKIHKKHKECRCKGKSKNAPLGFLSNIALDDIIIIGLIIILLMEEIEERDWGTIIALGFLLF